MKHVTVAGLARDRDFILDKLQDLGVIHLAPCAPETSQDEDSTELRKRVAYLQDCLDMLDQFRHKPYELEYTDDELPHVLCGLVNEWKDLHDQLFALRHSIAVYTPWGDFDPADVERLRELNVYVQLWSVPQKNYDLIEFPEGVYRKPIEQQIDLLFCTVNYGGSVTLEPPVVEVPLPPDRLSVMTADANELEARVKKLSDMFRQIASRRSVIVDALDELRTSLAFAIGREESYSDEMLFGVEGWVPAAQTSELRKGIKAVGRPVYVAYRDPKEDEEPPVLTKEPIWARPARAFFDILGVVPGYREFDISPVYVLAIALFTAMLIGDAGYGFVILLPLLIFYRTLRYKVKLDPNLLHMVIILAAATAAYGLITMTIFGWTPSDKRFVLLDSDNFDLMMWLCFIIGAVHLSVAHIWRACRRFTERGWVRGLADLGWTAAIWAAYLLVMMLVLNRPLHAAFWPLLIGGLALAIVFTAPRELLYVPFNALSCFSDIISYVRLMAVGAAGVIMERTFNQLALDLDNIVLTPLILVVAHTSVLALGAVAIFVHGVRLNLLEYSGHMDIMWSGRKYEPFCNYIRKENST